MEKRFDVFGMCNALFDIQAEVEDATLDELSLDKGGMMLLSHEEQRAIVPRIYDQIVNSEPGGSGANTMIGVALLGGKTCYTSRVGRDEHGREYRGGLETKGVKPNMGSGDGETGISLILITPDAQRTMCTYLGMSQELHPDDVNIEDLRASKYLYITGYLWDTETQKEAVLRAMQEARKSDVKVAFSLSDPFCVGRHKDDFTQLLNDHVDVVFANREEAQGMTDETDVVAAAKKLAAMSGAIAVVTKDKTGSLIVERDTVYEIPAYPVSAVDTTGAGDMYAAGVLYGLTQELPLPVAGRIGSYTAGKVVAKLGPRLEEVNPEAVQVLRTLI
ncbi:MAG: adenosine kinase [Armatimonadaceae bacterium]